MKIERAKITVRGAVQGVGFRPFVYRLATALGLRGWVLNCGQGVFIEVEGEKTKLDEFSLQLQREKPPHAVIQSSETSILDSVGYDKFEIRYSDDSGAKTVLILPDVGVCADCLRETFTPSNRRYLYPFTNCTNCGPRFSIIESLPYDRENTSMRKFAMCPECYEEYHDPLDRRFHAQPNACPRCGPQLELWETNPPLRRPAMLARKHDALLTAAEAIRDGRIVALKGIGGFQLIVDATNEDAVRRLRERKHREEKPFALMFPSLEAVRAHCELDDLETRLLTSPEAPIVLLKRKALSELIATSVAPKNPHLGVMLPYSPLHHLLLHELRFPVVATSGNLGGEPICIDENDALDRLQGIADMFLVHNRPIVRQMDDSIVRVVAGRTQILRRARGFAPLPIAVNAGNETSVLALGAHLKNTVALAAGGQIFLSQHIGDLESEPAYAAFCKAGNDFQNLYESKPETIACDLHPEYLSTKLAAKCAEKPFGVQHHYAHILACMAENEIEAPVLGIAWDGTGFGLDGSIWGGEFLAITETSFQRVAHLREFCLPGGEAAIKHPARICLALLWEIYGEKLFDEKGELAAHHLSEADLATLHIMLSQRINSPTTTSMGRLFDAVACLTGICDKTTFEGQAAMELEFVAYGAKTDEAYELRLIHESAGAIILDWEAMILEIVWDIQQRVDRAMISAKFHNALVEAAIAVARRMGIPKVALSGGCFQNKYLIERMISRLRTAEFEPYWHQRVPTNDGGIALGQVMAALRRSRLIPKQEPVVSSRQTANEPQLVTNSH